MDLAVKLEQLICDWIPERFYKRRIQLCGGPTEEGNGFAMWRRLHSDNMGEGTAHEYAGAGSLREFPEVATHLDAFYELFDKYGAELELSLIHISEPTRPY